MTLQQETQSWTVRDLMKVSIDHLQRHGFDEARLTVELLLSHALQCQRIQLYTRFDQPLTKDELGTFRSLFERRLRHEPVQYIVGSAGFMGMQFRVDPRVLIPRPETETLVEQTMLMCSRRPQKETITLLEIGTGSGNIAISLSKLVRGIQVTSIDANVRSLEVARENAEIHQVTDRVALHAISVFGPLAGLLKQKFDLLVSNPPYVSAEEWDHLAPEVREHEPRGAISDAKDGLEFYRRIGSVAGEVLRHGGQVLVEIGFGQSESVQEIFKDAGLTEISSANDLQGIPRVLTAKYP